MPLKVPGTALRIWFAQVMTPAENHQFGSAVPGTFSEAGPRPSLLRTEDRGSVRFQRGVANNPWVVIVELG